MKTKHFINYADLNAAAEYLVKYNGKVVGDVDSARKLILNLCKHSSKSALDYTATAGVIVHISQEIYDDINHITFDIHVAPQFGSYYYDPITFDD